MVEQKLYYIHQNPVRGKWQLVDDSIRYDYSSAGFYELGVPSKFVVTHYKLVGSDEILLWRHQSLRWLTDDSDGVTMAAITGLGQT